jgi:uncharacterized protein
MVRWRVGWRWYGAVAVPLVFFIVAIIANALAGNGWPHPADLARYSGLPDVGLLAVYVLALLVNGFGEETGWRGFALPHLQRRHRPLYASLWLAIGWAGWHLPLFFIVASFRGFSPATLPGFLIGLACGAILLTYMYNGTGGSVLLVALWHTTYNAKGRLLWTSAALPGAVHDLAAARPHGIITALAKVRRGRLRRQGLPRRRTMIAVPFRRIEADHSQLKRRLRRMRHLRHHRTAAVIIAGHAFIQNLRRGHYHLTAGLPTNLRLAAAFDELSHAI